MICDHGYQIDNPNAVCGADAVAMVSSANWADQYGACQEHANKEAWKDDKTHSSLITIDHYKEQ